MGKSTQPYQQPQPIPSRIRLSRVLLTGNLTLHMHLDIKQEVQMHFRLLTSEQIHQVTIMMTDITQKLIDDVLDHKVAKVVITYKDRLSRVGFELFYHLFKKFGTEIVVASQIGSEKLDSEEIFEEIVSLLHCYSMKMYSKRRVAKIKEAFEDDKLNNEGIQNKDISDEIANSAN